MLLSHFIHSIFLFFVCVTVEYWNHEVRFRVSDPTQGPGRVGEGSKMVVRLSSGKFENSSTLIL